METLLQTRVMAVAAAMLIRNLGGRRMFVARALIATPAADGEGYNCASGLRYNGLYSELTRE